MLEDALGSKVLGMHHRACFPVISMDPNVDNHSRPEDVKTCKAMQAMLS